MCRSSVEDFLVAAHISHEGRCATGMPALESTGDKEVTAEIEGALKRRLGADRFDWWFAQGLRMEAEAAQLLVFAPSAFVLERIRKRLLTHLRGASGEVYGRAVNVCLRVINADAESTDAGSTTDDGDVQTIASVLAVNQRGSKRRTTSGDELNSSTDGEALPPASKSAANSRATDSAKRAKSANGLRATKRASSTKTSGPAKLASSGSSSGLSIKRADGENDPSTPAAPTIQSQLAGTSLANFCVGSCNQLAHMAAKMVVEQPGSASPLFFWGPAGTGKTHLLAAIRNELRSRHRLPRVVMLSAEQFTNDFTGAVRGSGLPGFRRRYRDVDALLIDDVQFVGGKRATLRELLYTVDTLLRGRCQLAFSADRPPLELEGLNEELAGRMAGGMVGPLRPLDRDTRRQVLGAMAKRDAAMIRDDVLDRLAEELAGDGRLLSGAVNHLRTLGQMLERPATWDELLTSAPELIAAGRPAVNLNDIQKAVCDMFGLQAGALRSRGQQRAVSQPRMLAMYLARQYTRAAFSEIGEYFGNRSHSTVIAATKRVEDWIAGSKPLRRGAQSVPPRQMLEAIENLLRTG
ncbi:DnaA ATPase domain-containing protein [Planctomycetaceae bacterium SH139]